MPNIFAQDELDTIFTAMKPVVLDLGLQPTKANLYSAFTKRVRANTHSVVCMRYVYTMWFNPWFKFNFPFLWGIVMYDNEFETRGNKI